MKLVGLILAGAAVAVRKAYLRGRASGVLDGIDIGRKRGFADGLARGTVIASAAFAGVSLQRPILEDLTPGGRLEERMPGATDRKPS